MANTKSAKKAARASARKTDVNKSRRTRMRNLVKKVEAALESKDATAAAEALKNAEPVMARAAQQGVIHRNTASRKVARLAKQVKLLSA
jgi:small subunit ribosomal protein S20